MRNGSRDPFASRHLPGLRPRGRSPSWWRAPGALSAWHAIASTGRRAVSRVRGHVGRTCGGVPFGTGSRCTGTSGRRGAATVRIWRNRGSASNDAGDFATHVLHIRILGWHIEVWLYHEWPPR